jgi:hypothetical protein
MKPAWLINLILLVCQPVVAEGPDNTDHALLPATGKSIIDLHVHV